jgi:NAD(P)-dependent dehydrogenase (short-subunit alcohol dehydrogenase family)
MPQTKIRKVLVTGGSSGIGLATVQTYLGKGYFVVSHYRETPFPMDAIEACHKEQLVTIQADLIDEKQVNALLEQIRNKYGSVDVLVNNAGAFHYSKDYRDHTGGQFKHTLAVNLIAPFILSKALIPNMISNNWGRIVNISSISVSHGGSPSSVAYTCSKAALEALTRNYAKLGAQNNVLVNALQVGLTDTDFHHHNTGKSLAKRIAMIPMKRMAAPEEIASVVYFYGSGENTYTTGSVIKVTGGE